MMSRRFLSAAAAVLFLAACSNGSNSDATSTPSPTASSAAFPSFTDAPDLSSQTRENPNPTTPPEQRFNTPSVNSSIRKLMSDYRSLRSRVETFISRIGNGERNDNVLQDGGSQWYDDERSFQSDIDALPVKPDTLPQYLQVKVNLGEAEQFLYAAGSDAMGSCNASSARQELKVANYFFAAVQHEMNAASASADDASNPPEVDSAANKCSE
jgi:hypothetical protein